LSSSTAQQIAVAQQIYTKTMEAFKMCNLIECTIIQQIKTAVDPDCLADLIDDDTGLLEGPVATIMKQLFETYGAITPQTLTAAKATLETNTYNHTKPIVNIFTAINDYANMAEAADAAETQTQLINIGLIIITRSTIFSSDIRKWNSRPEDEKPGQHLRPISKKSSARSNAVNQSSPPIPWASTAKPTPPPSSIKSSNA